MKKIIIAFAATMLAVAAFSGQKSTAQDGWYAPTAVLNNFSKRYPDAQRVKWEYKNGNHKAEFYIGYEEKSSYFKADGTWVKTKTEIHPADVPEAVVKYVRANYPNWYIEDVEYIEDAERGNYYDIEIEKGRSEKHIRVKPEGA